VPTYEQLIAGKHYGSDAFNSRRSAFGICPRDHLPQFRDRRRYGSRLALTKDGSAITGRPGNAPPDGQELSCFDLFDKLSDTLRSCLQKEDGSLLIFKMEVDRGYRGSKYHDGSACKTEVPPPLHRNWLSWAAPVFVFIFAAVLFFTITGKWNDWTGGVSKQTTDDAYLHADLTPPSTKVPGVAAKVNVSGYSDTASAILCHSRIHFEMPTLDDLDEIVEDPAT